ncbi:hypothetical protein Tco_1456493 [Tanacetum coccineum]
MVVYTGTTSNNFEISWSSESCPKTRIFAMIRRPPDHIRSFTDHFSDGRFRTYHIRRLSFAFPFSLGRGSPDLAGKRTPSRICITRIHSITALLKIRFIELSCNGAKRVKSSNHCSLIAVAELKDMVRAFTSRMTIKTQLRRITRCSTSSRSLSLRPGAAPPPSFYFGIWHFPGNTVTSPKEDLQGITTRSEKMTYRYGCDEYLKMRPGFSKSDPSGNPTPYIEPIVSCFPQSHSLRGRLTTVACHNNARRNKSEKRKLLGSSSPQGDAIAWHLSDYSGVLAKYCTPKISNGRGLCNLCTFDIAALAVSLCQEGCSARLCGGSYCSWNLIMKFETKRSAEPRADIIKGPHGLPDFANYLRGNSLSSGMDINTKINFKDVTHYFWDDPFRFRSVLIMVIKELMFSGQDSFRHLKACHRGPTEGTLWCAITQTRKIGLGFIGPTLEKDAL